MIDSYAALKDFLRLNSGDSRLGPQVGSYIKMAEAFFNRELRVTEMETRSQADLDGEYLVFPTDFLDLVRMELSASENKQMDFVSAQAFKDIYSASGTPRYFTIEDGQFRFRPAGTVAAPTSIEIIYYARIPALSDANTTNWLLDKNPDLYVNGALHFAGKFITDFNGPQIQADELLFQIDRMNSRARQRRYGGEVLRIRSGVCE